MAAAALAALALAYAAGYRHGRRAALRAVLDRVFEPWVVRMNPSAPLFQVELQIYATAVDAFARLIGDRADAATAIVRQFVPGAQRATIHRKLRTPEGAR